MKIMKMWNCGIMELWNPPSPRLWRTSYENGKVLHTLLISIISYFHIFTFAYSSSAAPVLDGSGIRIEFDSEERGFDCLSIKNKMNGREVQFGDGEIDGSRAGLWAMKFWKDGSPSQTRWLTNHNPSRRSVKSSDGRLKFLWEGLSLGDEKDVVDVAAAVDLSEDGESAKWRIQVRNRSKTWGLAEVEYPIVRHVVVSNTASALLPHGNTGGRLYERYSEGYNLLYPHGTVPVQTLAFMMDGVGLQFTALDGKAQNKAFNTRGLDMKIWYRCPDEGRPGAANAPDPAGPRGVRAGFPTVRTICVASATTTPKGFLPPGSSPATACC